MFERKSFSKKVFSGLVGGLMLSNTLGCSLFSPRLATGPQDAGFRQQASVSSNPVPLPVEIVSDISTIASGGNIPQEGVWRPAYPENNAEQPDAQAASPAEGVEPVAEAAKEVVLNADGTVKEPEVSNEESAQATTATPGKSKGKRRRVASTGGKTETYKVRSGDTLMKISFEKFGNIYRWREIYDSNKSRIANLNKLSAGTMLTIQGIEYIVIERNGTPYLIRRGETLVKISKNVYNTPTEWKSIWKNNRQLIHDPNKIYAGFTLYYVPKKTDEIPQQVRQISTEKPAAKPMAISETEARTIPGVSLAPASVTGPEGVGSASTAVDAPAAPPAVPADGAWTASPATPIDSTTAPSAKP